ncbi:MAG: single-stranded DNA-binding protein [Marmoricola sp.]
MSDTGVSNTGDDAGAETANLVRIRGRLGADPTQRTLPSGTDIVSFRVVIARSPTVMTRGSRQKSDWVDCTAWSSPTRRRAVGWRAGDVVEVEGALRRRHYRSGDTTGSRVEVEMLGGRRVTRASPVAGRT